MPAQRWRYVLRADVKVNGIHVVSLFGSRRKMMGLRRALPELVPMDGKTFDIEVFSGKVTKAEREGMPVTWQSEGSVSAGSGFF